MDVVTPPRAVAALAAFVRKRLAEAAETLVPFLVRSDDVEVLPPGKGIVRSRRSDVAARNVAMVIVGAAAPFAPTPQARMRLLRQMAASGLLTQRESDEAVQLLSAVR
jgi:hypothetical protein